MGKLVLILPMRGWIGGMMVYNTTENVTKLNRRNSGLLNFGSQIQKDGNAAKPFLEVH